MKVAVLAMLFALLVVTQSKRKGCRTTEDCDDDQCCIISRGMFRLGRCKNLAREGKPCRAEDDAISILGGKHLHNCPCISGLTCVHKKEKDHPIFGIKKVNQRCVNTTSTDLTDVESEEESDSETSEEE